ncbi:MAG: hypothetical protein IIA61_07135 [Candidatus Marinimicrobia bacterium]|nr:hypothetical protein [Candidatus Neomarinimicrobiota bacterium]
MAEIELSVLARQCLDRRIPDKPVLTREVATWQRERNTAKAKVDWRFITVNARIKLKRLSPEKAGKQTEMVTYMVEVSRHEIIISPVRKIVASLGVRWSLPKYNSDIIGEEI